LQIVGQQAGQAFQRTWMGRPLGRSGRRTSAPAGPRCPEHRRHCQDNGAGRVAR